MGATAVKRRKRSRTLAERKAMTGRLFTLPFYIGFLFFFAIPMGESISYVFSNLTLEVGGFEREFVGLQNINYIFKVDAYYTKALLDALVQLVYQVPIILLMSLFFAILLNQKFIGRTLARAIFFLPVIVASGVVIQTMRDDAFAQSLVKGASTATTIFNSNTLGDILFKMGINKEIVDYLTWISNNMFDILWKTGIQMIIFLAGLQTIPPSLYEASSIEGATSWENFWMITIPMISPMIVVNIVYTMVDVFTDRTNPVMSLMQGQLAGQKFSIGAAMSWTYFLIVGVALAVIMSVVSRMVKRVQ